MNVIRAWNGFWFGPTSARPLAAFRIVFGCLVLLNLFLLSLEIDYWFTNQGLLQGTESREAAGPLRPSVLHYIQDPVAVRVFFAATAVVATLFTIGWHTRIVSVLMYIMLLSIHHRNISSGNGADVLLIVLALYAMLSPCGAAYSLDARRTARRRGGPAEPLIIPWAQRLIQVQIALIYLNTGLLKASGATWQHGTAMHFVFCNEEIRRFNFEWMVQYPVLVNLMTYTALILELALPFLLWVKKARPWVMLGGIGMHAAIVFFVNIPMFGELMVASYLTFLTADELDQLLRIVNPRNWLQRKQPKATLPASHRPAGPAVIRTPHWRSEFDPDVTPVEEWAESEV